MSVLIDENTRVLVQGITGHQGRSHTRAMLDYGTRIVAGVTPGRGGETVEGVPVYDTVARAVEDRGPFDISILFVPAPHVRDACTEALDAGVLRAVVVAEHVPLHDELRLVHIFRRRGGLLLGPNCPGLASPGKSKVGIMPNHIFRPPGSSGGVGVVSRSGTLTYEIVYALSLRGIGQTTVIGVGGDRVCGTTMTEAARLLMEDGETRGLVMVGEIGGRAEEETALLAERYDKPVAAYIAGRTAPPEKRMGHAGALIGEGGSAGDKISFLRDHGITVASRPGEVADITASLLGL
ncbi:MAG: succinate--CoA ligase subunit alpha [Thermoplasmata archaeon]|nr:succinate--CoA ligase subunit alpha [Thermoplasmata archaeon]